MGIIKAENLSYKYIRRDEENKIIDEVLALENINIDIEEGQFVAVVGHNGSGKSTFAKLVNALAKPTSGKLFVDGMDTSDESKLWEIRKTAGMVFQNPDNQIIASVVEEDVAFGPENIGIPSEEICERVRVALETVGMSEFALSSPNRLSGGQKQRIAIAGALAMMPKCIIFDESTAMLDPIGRGEVMRVIRDLNREKGMTILLITHYMEEAAEADRIVVLRKGRLEMDGTPREVFSDKARLEACGLELPPAAELAHELKASGVNLPEGIISVDEVVDAVANEFGK